MSQQLSLFLMQDFCLLTFSIQILIFSVWWTLVMQFSGLNNRMLLWHGSRLTNWAGILSQGYSIWASLIEYHIIFVCSTYHKRLYSKSRFTHCSSRGNCVRLWFWEGCLFCRYVYQKCRLLWGKQQISRCCFAFVWGLFFP